MEGPVFGRLPVLNRVETENGPEPLRWQTRLFQQLCANDVPSVCDLPTGMGKTSIIHLWMLALRHQIIESKPRLPTRLVYVVDRRTVVDQATDIAERIQRNLPSLGLPKHGLSVSTLRGQLADNREWTRDPAMPAIIIGTVDMIGSRLLFSGYRSSYKQRPLDAGLLGQDSLLILDEAHLSEPFERLVRSLGRLPARSGTPDAVDVYVRHGHEGRPNTVQTRTEVTSKGTGQRTPSSSDTKPRSGSSWNRRWKGTSSGTESSKPRWNWRRTTPESSCSSNNPRKPARLQRQFGRGRVA